VTFSVHKDIQGCSRQDIGALFVRYYISHIDDYFHRSRNWRSSHDE